MMVGKFGAASCYAELSLEAVPQLGEQNKTDTILMGIWDNWGKKNKTYSTPCSPLQ